MTAPETIPQRRNAALSITLFGPMQVLVQGRPLPHLRSRKSLYLLALLTLRHGRPVEREWLAGTLWPEVDSSQAFANMRPVLSGLRDALGAEGGRLQSPNRRTLLLDLTDADVDLLTFDTAAASSKLPALEEAVGLYRGPLLEGCAEEWIFQDREIRAQAILKALQTLATAAQEAENHEVAAGWWRRAMTLDPLGATVRRGLMNALAGSGDTNAALHVYREFTVALQSDDPRAVPDAETTARYRRLRDGVRQKAQASASSAEDIVPPSVSGYLPHAPTELIGREDERLEVAERLRRSRLVTLAGPGGIGKTRLAVAVAGDVVHTYPDGVCLVSLESLRADSNVSEEGQPVIQQIASVMGIKTGMGRPLLTAVIEFLRRKRILLVLDNCEHLLEPAARVVAALLRECLGVRVLATGRETLGIGGEAVWSVPTLTTPDTERLPAGKTALARALAGYDSVHLFVERAQGANKNFLLTGDNAREVAILCARLEGVPLAIELAAARTATLTPAQILAQFDAHPLDALASRQRDIAPRHRTLRATLEWSYSLLAPEARAFLADMSVFRGGWTLEAAQAVCPDADAVEMLALLQNASLVNAADTEEGSRFSLLETVRQFAAQTVAESGQLTAVKQRHARYYWGWVVEAYEEPHRHRFFNVVEREYANVTAALNGTVEIGDEALLLQFCHDLTGFWEHTGRLRECRQWMEIVAQQLSNAENQEVAKNPWSPRTALLSSNQIQFLHTQGTLLSTMGDFEAAAEPFLRIVEDYRRSGNLIGGRTHLFNTGVFLLSVDLRRSLTLLQQCLPLERASSRDGRANPVILSQLAVASRLAGQSAKATAFMADALEVGRRQEEIDPHGCGRAMWSAGLAALAECDLPQAMGFFENAVVIARRLRIAILETYALCGLASVARATGDREQDKTLLAEAIVASGPTPAVRLGAMLRKEQVERFLASEDRVEAEIQTRTALEFFRGKARSARLFTYPLLLLLADTTRSSSSEPNRIERAARLFGAAGAVAERLGLVAPDWAEKERNADLQIALARQMGPERLADEEAAGAILDDEAALEYALTQA